MLTLLTHVWWLPIAAAPIIGSFLTVLATRLTRGETVIWGRSVCPHCRHALRPIDLVPLASWLLLRGRCRYCAARLSPLYPLVELGAVAMAVCATLMATGWLAWVSCGLGWSLLTLAIVDWREGLLPDALTLPLIPAGLAVAYLEDRTTLVPHVIGAVVGFLAFALIRIAYRHFRGREGMGQGDPKLLAAAGAWVSWEGLPSVVLVGALATLLWIGGRSITGRRPSLATALPFGPGLCLGTWLVWLIGPLF